MLWKKTCLWGRPRKGRLYLPQSWTVPIISCKWGMGPAANYDCAMRIAL